MEQNEITDRIVNNLIGLPKSTSLPYCESLEYYTTNIGNTMCSSPVPIIIDNGSYEFRAVSLTNFRVGVFKMSQ